jgi:putative colanic acid biosynthesis UDP-glucose lipid carrier transferase
MSGSVSFRAGPSVADECRYETLADQFFIVERGSRSPLGLVGRAAAKRCVDILLGSVLLALCLPIILAAAAAVKFESKGPAFIRQARYGYRRRAFRILKLRTMNVIEDGSCAVQCQENDVRVTRLGWFLRRTSIDELPQLLNVLLGEMSLVGPRPHPTALDDYYESKIPGYFKRFAFRPGITGLAQVSGHRGPTVSLDRMRARLSADLTYVRAQSLWLDLWILAATLPVCLRGTNAL